MQLWQRQAHMPQMPHTLLSPSHEKPNKDGNAMGRPKNDTLPPTPRHQAPPAPLTRPTTDARDTLYKGFGKFLNRDAFSLIISEIL